LRVAPFFPSPTREEGSFCLFITDRLG